MNSEAMKKEHIASIDIALYPFISALHSLHDISGLNHDRLKAEPMRAFHDPKRTLLQRAIVKRYPSGKTLFISTNCRVVLMGVNHTALEVRKDKSCRGLRMDKKLRTDKELHRL